MKVFVVVGVDDADFGRILAHEVGLYRAVKAGAKTLFVERKCIGPGLAW